MIVTGDYHTHTKYSKNLHAKHTILQMVEFADDLGLNSLGISDHGPKHLFFGIKKSNIDKARQQIDQINSSKKYNVKVLMGIEANLIGKDGTIDLNQEQISKLDNLLVGFHKGAKNNIYSFFKSIFNPKKQIEINTNAYINCLNKYNVTILTHINDYIKVDVFKVASEAKKHGTLIELNNKHLNFTKEQAEDLVKSGCNFILSSDAHKKQSIARLENVLKFIETYNIPLERIVNVDKLFK